MLSLPGWGILSPLSTDSTPWFSRLLNGLPQLKEREQRNISIQMDAFRHRCFQNHIPVFVNSTILPATERWRPPVWGGGARGALAVS